VWALLHAGHARHRHACQGKLRCSPRPKQNRDLIPPHREKGYVLRRISNNSLEKIC
jgi:hypothetical protein